MRYALFAEVCEKYGNMWQSHICVKLTCLHRNHGDGLQCCAAISHSYDGIIQTDTLGKLRTEEIQNVSQKYRRQCSLCAQL